MTQTGVKISMVGTIVFIIGAIGVGIDWITSCEGPAYWGCGSSQFTLPLAIAFFVGIGMVFLGTRFDKNKTKK
jgi:hypothetical protein